MTLSKELVRWRSSWLYIADRVEQSLVSTHCNHHWYKFHKPHFVYHEVCMQLQHLVAYWHKIGKHGAVLLGKNEMEEKNTRITIQKLIDKYSWWTISIELIKNKTNLHFTFGFNAIWWSRIWYWQTVHIPCLIRFVRSKCICTTCIYCWVAIPAFQGKR